MIVENTQNGFGCYSHVGYQGEMQVVSLQSSRIGKGCFVFGSIIHEFLHGKQTFIVFLRV